MSLPVKAFRDKITQAENKLRSVPSSVEGAELDAFCPLVHSFADHLYIREIFMPRGAIIISRIHKYAHPYFVLTGKASVYSEIGEVLIQAPYYGITPMGTKRILFIHEDMHWVTVHSTKLQNVEEIIKEVTVDCFEDLPSREEE